MEADNIFTDQVKVCRPVFLKLLIAVSITIISDSRDIVGQRVKPYIGNVLRIKADRDSPLKGGSGYAEILKSRKQEVVHHLVLSGYRLDKLRMLVDVFDELRSIFTHTEEICLFLCRLYRTSAVRAFSVNHLGRSPEGFTRCAVKSLIMSFVDIALII